MLFLSLGEVCLDACTHASLHVCKWAGSYSTATEAVGACLTLPSVCILEQFPLALLKASKDVSSVSTSNISEE